MAASKLLVVDSEPASLKLITEIFAAMNTRVHSVSDHPTAARLVEQERFDGIFVGVDPPKLDGFELVQMVRQSVPNRSTPVVVVAANKKGDVLYKSFAAGATFFLPKPIDTVELEHLLHTIQGTLHEKRRQYTRVPLETEVVCRVGNRILEGMTWNVSQGGMQVEVGHLEHGDLARLSFTLPYPPIHIEVTGVVAWAGDKRQGIHFTEMSLENQEILHDFISQLMLSPK